MKHKTHYAIRKRNKKDIWENLFEFLLLETESMLSPPRQLLLFQKTYNLKAGSFRLADNEVRFKQRLSHQIIHFQFLKAETFTIQNLEPGIIWVDALQLQTYPFPKTLQKYINEYL
jgi:A/G-specific adenine glycosylase